MYLAKTGDLVSDFNGGQRLIVVLYIKKQQPRLFSTVAV
jgi:hypothetical protein